MNPYPEHTPPTPPEGMKWEYRGRDWRAADEAITLYAVKRDGKVSGVIQTKKVFGSWDYHYFEAVPIGDDSDASWKGDSETMNPLDPKGAAGAAKPQLHLIPTVAMQEEAKALADGAKKYGLNNWRENQVCATTYIGAILRHLTAYRDGEDVDPESKSGVNHLGSVRACCAILLDAAKCGTLVDDRPKHVTELPTLEDLETEIRKNLEFPRFEPKSQWIWE